MKIHQEETMDEKKIEQAVKLFLEGIGEDVHREGLVETPDRVVRMCRELFGGMDHDASKPLSKVFTADSGLVLEKNIEFYSVCEHHLLPFFGHVHIAYLPDGKVLGLSKLARTVEVYARRPQIQEQLGKQIAQAIMEAVKPKGVMVVIEAEHMCMSMRGIKKESARTTTISAEGCFDGDLALQNTVLQMLA